MLGFESLMLHWHGLLMGVGDLRFEFWKLLDRDMGEGRNASPGGSWVAQVFFFVFVLWLLGAGRKQVFAEHWGNFRKLFFKQCGHTEGFLRGEC
jgi:hypothetical protein